MRTGRHILGHQRRTKQSEQQMANDLRYRIGVCPLVDRNHSMPPRNGQQQRDAFQSLIRSTHPLPAESRERIHLSVDMWSDSIAQRPREFRGVIFSRRTTKITRLPPSDRDFRKRPIGNSGGFFCYPRPWGYPQALHEGR